MREDKSDKTKLNFTYAWNKMKLASSLENKTWISLSFSKMLTFFFFSYWHWNSEKLLDQRDSCGFRNVVFVFSWRFYLETFCATSSRKPKMPIYEFVSSMIGGNPVEIHGSQICSTYWHNQGWQRWFQFISHRSRRQWFKGWYNRSQDLQNHPVKGHYRYW